MRFSAALIARAGARRMAYPPTVAIGRLARLRADSAVQAKNIGQGLVMSGMMRSSPGTEISSFMSSSASQSWQPV
jgi:hypothetical protein